MSGMDAVHLIQHAQQCEAQAKTAREFAEKITSMGDPIGQGIVALALGLRRHNLCVITKEALECIRAIVRAYDAFDADDSDHPSAREQERLVEAIDRSLNPPSTVL
jgi:hypothetical protein